MRKTVRGGAAAVLILAFLATSVAGAPLPRLILQKGHTDGIWSLAYSPDGRLLASAGHDKTVRLWQVKTGRLLATLVGHTDDVGLVAFRPDGSLLASAGADDTVRLWDTATGSARGVLRDAPGEVSSLAFTSDGRLLAAGAHDGVHFWDMASLRQIRVIQTTRPIQRVAFSPVQPLLAGRDEDGAITIWNTATGKPLRTMASEKTLFLCPLFWSADGRTIISAGKTTTFWDAATGRRLRTAWFPEIPSGISPDRRLLFSSNHEGEITLWSLKNSTAACRIPSPKGHFSIGAFSPRDRFVAFGGEYPEIHFWNLKAKRSAAVLGSEFDYCLRLAISPDGLHLAAGSANGTFSLWDLAVGAPRTVVRAGKDAVGVAFAPDGRVVASFGSEGVRLWSADSGAPLRVLDPRPAGQVRFSPDGHTLAALPSAGPARLWNLDTGELRGVINEPSLLTRAMAFTPDSRYLLLAVGQQTVGIYDARTARLVSGLMGHEKPIMALAVAPDGSAYLTGSHDGTARIWDARTFASIVLDGHHAPVGAVAFTPDGRRVVTCGLDSTARIWDARTGRPLATLPGAWGDFAVAADGTLATHLGQDVTVWNPDGSRIARLIGHTDEVGPMVFGPGGRYLVTGSKDTSIRFWNPRSGALLATLVQVNGGADWIVVSPQGFFDGSAGGMGRILWRVGARITDTAVAEQYFNDFFEPGLLADVLREGRPIPEILKERGDLRAGLTISARDRRLPVLRLEAPRTSRERVATVRIRVRDVGSGVRDLRLFRNGTLVRRWRGTVASGVLTAHVVVVADRNALTAYAFNRDNVKSEDATTAITGDEALRRAPRAWILAVGINAYADPRHRLHYAAADARLTADALRRSMPLPAAAIHAETLLDGAATRAGMLQALRRVVAAAQPEDEVIVSFAGHGIRRDGHLVLLAQDLAGISDVDLEAVFAKAQAQHILLILDACHSGQALAAKEWRRGPLNARGLAQLAWEKGMDVLAASQSQQSALEAQSLDGREIGHGLLTYALMEDGLAHAPRTDGRLLAGDWIDYAAARVPGLLEARQMQGRGMEPYTPTESPWTPPQVPRAFHPRERGRDWAVAGGR